MSVYQRIFSVKTIAASHERYLAAIREAERVGLIYAKLGRPSPAAATLVELRRAYALFNRELDTLAKASAADATAKIKAQIRRTSRLSGRDFTGGKGGRHLSALIVSRPVHRFAIATGEVGVADEAFLDKAINPLYPGHGTYWKAQEYGSSANVGRTIMGYFYRAGYTHPEVPRAGGGTHPLFVPGRPLSSPVAGLPTGLTGGTGPGGGIGGLGVIQRPIRARHFIERGANAARADWLAGVRTIERQALRRLGGL